MRPIQKAVAFLLMGVTLLHTTACSGLKKANDSQNTIKITLSPRYTNLESVLETEFPDIRFEFEHYTGPASTEYLRTQLMHNDAGDIFLSTLKFDDITCKEHLMDISGYNFVGNYESSLLNQYDVDGAIYMLPGPVIIRSMHRQSRKKAAIPNKVSPPACLYALIESLLSFCRQGLWQ